jgi:toxin ParE1/3/4
VTVYRLTPAAQRDLSSIWDYTAERWNLAQAETYANEIRAALERIADDPRRGRPCDEIRESYLRYGIGSHLLFYRENVDGGVDVIRILHQRMDPTRHL